MKGTKAQKGITLIALIITIVVLLILAVVAINSIQNDGVIKYAQNATDTWNQVEKNEATTLGEYEKLIRQYNVGEEVSIGEEKFYVIKDNITTVTLLAEKAINTIALKQGSPNYVKFADTIYWSNETSYPLDLNTYKTIPDDSAIAIAKAYAEQFEGATGRLIRMEEVEELKLMEIDSEIWLYEFFTSTATSATTLCYNMSYDELIADGAAGTEGYVRPVIEISKSKISE